MNVSTTSRNQCLNSTQVVYTLMLLAILGLSSFSTAASTADQAEEVVVIVPAGSSINTISKTKLRAIFGMRSRTWPQGNPIKVFVLEDDDPVHASFSKQVLNTFPFNLRRIWDRRVYSGTGQSPVVVKTEAEMRSKISGNEHSIGYIRRNRVDAGVKVVNIQ